MKLIILLLLISSNANAITLGTGIIHTKPKQKVISQEYKPSLTVGQNWNYKNINVGILTNKLFSRSGYIELENGLKVKQKVKYDALQVGYRVKRVIPALFIANTQVTKQFLGKKTVNNLLVYGASLNYLVTKKVLIGILGTSPNEEGQSFGLTFNYIL